MKNTDYLDALKKKSPDELKAELVELRREQFNLRMQASMGQMNQTHLTRDARKKVARVQTLLNQKSK